MSKILFFSTFIFFNILHLIVYIGVEKFNIKFYKIGTTILKNKYQKKILLNNIGEKIIKNNVTIKINSSNNILFASDYGRGDPCIFGECNIDQDGIIVSYKVSPFIFLIIITIFSSLFYFFLGFHPFIISDILFFLFMIIICIGFLFIFYIIKINSIKFEIDWYINNEM
jgi:hypothetical protein